MHFLERLTASEAAASAVLAAGNAWYFGRYSAGARPRPKRVAAGVLTLVNLALAAEALLYLAFLPEMSSGEERSATVAVRSILLLAAASVFALVLRGRKRERRRS